MNSLYKIPLFFFNGLFPCKIYGKENLPSGGTVIVSNHFHAMDCGYIAKLYNKDIYFLAKQELFKKKSTARLLKSLGGIPIDRDNPDLKSMMSVLKILKEEHKLVIFPEGTRNKTGTNDLQPIKGGAIIFAVKAKKPIVPIMFLKKGGFFKPTKMIVGEPFELSEYYGKKLLDTDLEEMAKIVSDKMIEQQDLLRKLVKSKTKK